MDTMSSAIRIAVRGLSDADEALLRKTLSDGKSFFGKQWSIERDTSAASCAIAIIDIDDPNGQIQWQSIEDDTLPVKVAYTQTPENIDNQHFKLSKPLWSGELMVVMVRILTQLNESTGSHLKPVTTPAPMHRPRSAESSGKPPISAVDLANGLDLHDRFRLKRWPNIKQLDVVPKIQLLTLMTRQGQDIDTIERLGHLSTSDTVRFINQCYELGYLNVDSSEPQKPSGERTKFRSMGLIRKIRNRLGLT